MHITYRPNAVGTFNKISKPASEPGGRRSINQTWHVIASGNPASPPLILLHPIGVGGFVWSSIINVLSEKWRTHALDTIGDVGKSELAESIPETGSPLQRMTRRLRQPGHYQAEVVAGQVGREIGDYVRDGQSVQVVIGVGGSPSCGGAQDVESQGRVGHHRRL